MDITIQVSLTTLRSLADLSYLFHNRFVAPSSRVFGRGELVKDPKEIALRYLKSDFLIDLAATLPFPQIVIWVIMPAVRSSTADHANDTLALIVLIQYVPRLFLIFPLNRRIIKTTGVVAKTAWAGAAYNLLYYMLASHTSFCILICIVGLVLFSHLIGNMHSYLQSMTVRVEEWRIKQRGTKEWMRHRQLPFELQERVRRFVQYKWLATRGVDEESILRSLPLDLRREIQRHLCLALVRRIKRLVQSLSMLDTYMVREGDPVNKMLFIIRFFNSITLKPGDFCGEELLTWALMPNSSLNLPSSTRTVRCLGEVEAFALRAEDLKFVAGHFKRLHSKKLQHAFRYYSHQWRTWGACFIQAAWRRYKKRKLAKELARHESLFYMPNPDEEYTYDDYASPLIDSGSNTQPHLGATILASKFAKNTRRVVNQKVQANDPASTSLKMPKLFKPDEPDFSADDV
ncbi:hypothetical protein MKX01_026162 [Papaver californicum]|nr:hypothetical protein MKX01_026162 [Papaver californicum]